MDSLVLTLQLCGNAVASSVTCKHGDSVAEVRQCGVWIFSLTLMLWPSYLFTVEAMGNRVKYAQLKKKKKQLFFVFRDLLVA